MKKHFLGVFAATMIVVPWGAAGAQDMPPPHPGGPAAMMKKADTDGDGRISRAEATAHHAQRFSKLDEDGDGTVPRDLFVSKTTDKIMRRMSRQGIEERVGKRFDRIDKNGDHVLTKEEYSAKFNAHFDRMDKNGDGFLDPSERPRHGGHGSGHGGGGR